MNSGTSDSDDLLSIETLRHLEAIFDRFEVALRANKPLSIPELLQGHHGTSRTYLLRELIRLEVEHRLRAGERPDLRAYGARFPELTSQDLAELASLKAPRLKTLFPRNSSVPTVVTVPGSDPEHLQLEVFDKYLGLVEIGRGGMGVVYKAQHRALQRTIALKMIQAGSDGNPEDLLRFKAEAEAVAALNHPYIISIYEVGSCQGIHYIALEYCPKGSLADYLKQGSLSVEEAVTIVKKVARGMAVAHARGIIHRDLKPGNIMLGTDGEPKVSDFGLAKQVQASAAITTTGAIIGTPAYMAPEQASGQGKRVGVAADVYALGAMLYHLLGGRPPFQASTPLETVWQVVHHEPKPLRQLQGQIPWDLEVICQKCLHKEPEHRYGSAEALAEDLQRWQTGMPILARPVSTRERCWKWIKRNRGISAGIAVALLALLTGTTVALWQSWKANQQAKQATEHAELARKQLHRAEDLLYMTQINAAQLAWDAGDAIDAFRLLASCRFDRRGWEHDYLTTRFQTGTVTLKQHVDPVTSVAISRDGRYLVSGSQDHTVRIWDAATGKTRRVLSGHSDHVTSVAMSADRQQIVSGSRDQTIRIWDLTSGDTLQVLAQHTGAVTSVAISMDGRRLVSGSDDHTIRIWDAATGKTLHVLEEHRGSIHCLAISPDGKRIASGGGGSEQDFVVRVWDVESGKVLIRFTEHRGAVNGIAFSPDGQRIASGGYDRRVRIWDVTTGRETRSLFKHTSGIYSIAFSPDGERIASGGFGVVRVWDADTGKTLKILRRHTDRVTCLTFTPDAQRIVSSSDDMTVQVWNTASDSPLQILRGHTEAVNSVAISPDGQQIVSGSDDQQVRIWDARTGHLLRTLQGHQARVTSVAISPDGRRIVSAGTDNTLRIWDANTGQSLRVLPTPSFRVRSVAVNATGQRIVTGSDDHTIRIWDANTGRVQKVLFGHQSGVTSVAISRRGHYIVSGSHDKTLRKWDTNTGQLIRVFSRHTGAVTSVAISANGRHIISGSDDKTIRVWDANAGNTLQLLKGHTRPVTSVAISAAGRRIVSGSHDQMVRVWDAATGQQLQLLRGPQLPASIVYSVAISPDGHRIISGSNDKTIWSWHAATAHPFQSLQGHTSTVTSVAFTADGRYLVSHDEAGITKVWDAATAQLLPDVSPPTTIAGATSPDGRYRVEIDENEIILVDIGLEARCHSWDRNRLASWIVPDHAWHEAQQDQAIEQLQPFKAAFHLEQLAGIEPWRADHAAHAAHAWAAAGQPERAAGMFIRAALAVPTVDLSKPAWLAEPGISE